MTREPGDILLITIDQLRADVLRGPLAGLVDTPTLDGLCRRGVVFDNHFTVAAPCSPARASLLTGLYAMNHRVVRNGSVMAPGLTNLAWAVRRLGLEPMLFGYTDTQPDPRERAPADPDLASYEGNMDGFRVVTEMRWSAGLEWPAFLKSQGYEVPRIPDALFDLWRPVDGRLGSPALYKAEHSDSAYLTDRALANLSVNYALPLLAHITYVRPHPPMVAPAPYHECVQPDGLPPPLRPAPDHPFVEAWFSEPAMHGLFWGFDGRCDGLTDEQVALLRATYLGLIAEVDANLGRLLAGLESEGRLENTLIVITSDHGEMLGDKGMWGKESMFDPVLKIPLIIIDPRGDGGRIVNEYTEIVDIMPTILEWLGDREMPPMDGRSLLPLMAGDVPGDWRNAIMAELNFGSPLEATRFQNHLGLPANQAGVAIWREPGWKYVHFGGGVPPMLFDLESDPGETVDLFADPEHADRASALCRRLLDHRLAHAATLDPL